MISLPTNKESYSILKGDGSPFTKVDDLLTKANRMKVKLASNARETGRFHVLTLSIVHSLFHGINFQLVNEEISRSSSNQNEITLKVNFAELRHAQENRAGYCLVKFILVSRTRK